MGKIYVVQYTPRGVAGYDGDIEKQIGDLREARKYLEKICAEWDWELYPEGVYIRLFELREVRVVTDE